MCKGSQLLYAPCRLEYLWRTNISDLWSKEKLTRMVLCQLMPPSCCGWEHCINRDYLSKILFWCFKSWSIVTYSTILLTHNFISYSRILYNLSPESLPIDYVMYYIHIVSPSHWRLLIGGGCMDVYPCVSRCCETFDTLPGGFNSPCTYLNWRHRYGQSWWVHRVTGLNTATLIQQLPG